MSASSFGQRFVVTTFGESHGPGLGAVVDGCPAGVPFDASVLERALARRRPGAREKSGAQIVTARDESDTTEVLSGIHEGKTLGTPIALFTRNRDQRSEDYAAIAQAPRAGHADDVWRAKFGHTDPRGGGRSSGRETVARVMAGAIAEMFVRAAAPRTFVHGFARQIGPHALSDAELAAVAGFERSPESIDAFTARFPSIEGSRQVEQLLQDAKQQGRSYGGTAELWVHEPPANLGQPVFHKLKADLAAAAMSVGATAAVELGDGAEVVGEEGSEFHRPDADPSRYGGIRGGISTGEAIALRVSFKPTSSVMDVAKRGRHDPCIVPRAIPVLEAMIWLVLADHLLWARGDRL